MKRFQTTHTPGRRTRLSAAVAAVLASCAFVPAASAMELETGNPDLAIRWDNQVRYAVVNRLLARPTVLIELAVDLVMHLC